MKQILFAMLGTVTCSVMVYAQSPRSCESLKSVTLPDTTISAAEMVAEGPLEIPGRGGASAGQGAAPPAPVVPAHCRVTAVIAPSTDSHIEVEFWMPAAAWNNKFEAVGNGGFAGTISYAAMAAALREGYATASTDTGHKGGSAVFAMGHPEKYIDFAWRAVHEMTVKGKSLIMAYYGKAALYSYWNGCSTGGRQGLKEAQRFPEDFDAILAGAPANFETHLHAWTVEVGSAAIKGNDNILPASKMPLLNRAVLAACDSLDKVKDGLLNDPRRCRFDPAVLLCKGAETEICLTADQVAAVKQIYAPAKFKNRQIIFPSFEPGSELAWANVVSNAAPPQIGVDTFMYLTYADPQWDWHNFDLDRDTLAADKRDDGVINAIDPDLSKFKARSGKLLMYHGWNDTAIAPENSINYHASVLKKMGSKQDDWFRLFMVPGMQHCGGGPGPNQFNAMAALERWREAGTPPEMLVATHVTGGAVDNSRPLCPYPQVAVYKGTGSIHDAASFSCKAP